MRINGFEQIKAFYSIVFNQEHDFKPQHISLYVFLINQNNRNNWVEWFKCPFDLGMCGSCISNKRTYYKTLNDLMEWGLLEYEKGENSWKAPKIKLEVLISTTTATASVPQSEPLVPQVVQPLLPPNIKPITSNLQPTIEDRKKTFLESLTAFNSKYSQGMLDEFFDYWTESGPKDKKFRMEKQDTFDIEKRLARWHKNNFNKPPQSAVKKESPMTGMPALSQSPIR